MKVLLRFRLQQSAAGFLAAMGAATAAAQSPPADILVRYDFDGSTEGWMVQASENNRHAARHRGAGGGYIEGEDETAWHVWYFVAPGEFATRIREAYGGSLSYRVMQQRDDSGFSDADIRILTGAGELTYNFDHSPGTDWTDFDAELVAAAGWTLNGDALDEATMRSALATAQEVWIRGEYRTGDDRAGLDAVTLRGAPADATVRIRTDALRFTGGWPSGTVRIATPELSFTGGFASRRVVVDALRFTGSHEPRTVDVSPGLAFTGAGRDEEEEE